MRFLVGKHSEPFHESSELIRFVICENIKGMIVGSNDKLLMPKIDLSSFCLRSTGVFVSDVLEEIEKPFLVHRDTHIFEHYDFLTNIAS